MKGLFILLSVLSSSACFADYECKIQEQVTSNSISSFKNKKSLSVRHDELKGMNAWSVATRQSTLQNGITYKLNYVIDGAIMCQDGNDCKVLGYIRGTYSDISSQDYEKFIGPLPRKHTVEIYGDGEQDFKIVNGKHVTNLKIVCTTK